MSSRIRREEKRLSHFADEAETRLNPARGKQERPWGVEVAPDPTPGFGESLKLGSVPTQKLHLPSAWHIPIVSRWPGY